MSHSYPTQRHTAAQRVMTSNIVFVNDDDVREGGRAVVDGNSRGLGPADAQHGNVRDRYPFLHASAGTTFIQPHRLMRASLDEGLGSPTSQQANGTIRTIEHAEGEWRSVPGCVRDTIVRLLRSAKQTAKQETAGRQASESAPMPRRSTSAATTPRPSSTAARTTMQRVSPTRRPLSARGVAGVSSAATRGSTAAIAAAPAPLGRRVSFIASDGLPTRRRSSSSTAALGTATSAQGATSHVSLSSTVARVLSTSPGRLHPAAASSPSPGQKATTSNSPGRRVSPQQVGSRSPAHDRSLDGPRGCNVPFGQHSAQHPYYDEERQQHCNPVPPTDPFAPVPRRSPTRGTTLRAVSPVAHSAPWRPTGVVQPYEPTEPFGTLADDGSGGGGGGGVRGGVVRNATHGRKLRSLATSNLMTMHNGIERMKADHERFLQGQLFAAMQQLQPSSAADTKRRATGSTASAAGKGPAGANGGIKGAAASATPTNTQRNALDNVSRLLKALHSASVELVAEFLTDEEKRYLGMHSHKYQTKQERETTYQYTRCSFKVANGVEGSGEALGELPAAGPATTAGDGASMHVERKLRLSDDDASLRVPHPKATALPEHRNAVAHPHPTTKQRGEPLSTEKRSTAAPSTRVPYYQYVDQQMSALHDDEAPHLPAGATTTGAATAATNGGASGAQPVTSAAPVRSPTSAVPPLRLPSKILLSPSKTAGPHAVVATPITPPSVPLRHNSSSVSRRVAASVNAILGEAATPEAAPRTTDTATTDASMDPAAASCTTATSDASDLLTDSVVRVGSNTARGEGTLGATATITTTTTSSSSVVAAPAGASTVAGAHRTIGLPDHSITVVPGVRVVQPQTKRPVALHKPIATPAAAASGKGAPAHASVRSGVAAAHKSGTQAPASPPLQPPSLAHTTTTSTTAGGSPPITSVAASTVRESSPDTLQPPSARGASVASHETATSVATTTTVSIGRRVIDLSQFKVHDSDDDSDDA